MVCAGASRWAPTTINPTFRFPTASREGADWQRAPKVNPQESISYSDWWRSHQDTASSCSLVEQSLKANQSIVAAEAAYRLALATVQASTASLFPVVTAGLSGSRSGTGAGAAATTGAVPGVYNTVAATASASWEPDLWGGIRRQIESAKASAQASDAQLAGERLSIAASIVSDYFQLRQADSDIQSLKQQQDIDAHILEMTRYFSARRGLQRRGTGRTGHARAGGGQAADHQEHRGSRTNTLSRC